MDDFRVALEVGHGNEDRFETVEAFADSGMLLTFLPSDLLERLGVTSYEERFFWEPCGKREVSFPVGWVRVRLEGRVQPTIAVFTEPGAQPYLGGCALVTLGFALDWQAGRLIPAVPVLPFL